MKKILYTLPLFIVALCFLMILFSSCGQQRYSLRTIKNTSGTPVPKSVAIKEIPAGTAVESTGNLNLPGKKIVTEKEMPVNIVPEKDINVKAPEKPSFANRMAQKMIAKKINKLTSGIAESPDFPAAFHTEKREVITSKLPPDYVVSKKSALPTFKTPTNQQLLTILLVLVLVLLLLVLLPGLIELILLAIFVLLILLILYLLGVI